MTLTQYVEHGHLAEGVFVVDHAEESIVEPANRSRIIERERDGHWEPEAWFVFPSHPHDPALEEYLTRIRWVGEQQYRQPHNHTEAVAALNIRRSIGVDRRVDWHYFHPRGDIALRPVHYDINVKDGNSLHLTVWSGIPFLDVRSGHVTVDFRSRWGNSLTIHEGASAHVVVPSADTKVTINNEGGTLTMDIPEGKNRVRVYSPVQAFDAGGDAIVRQGEGGVLITCGGCGDTALTPTGWHFDDVLGKWCCGTCSI